MPGPEGDAVRERFGRMVYELNVPQYCCGGLNFGYFYERSPIIAMTARQRRPIRWTTSRHPPCRGAARRMSGCKTGVRCTTRWAQASRFCGSIDQCRWIRW